MTEQTIRLTRLSGDAIDVDVAQIQDVRPNDGGATITIAGSARPNGRPPIASLLMVQESETQVRALVSQPNED